MSDTDLSIVEKSSKGVFWERVRLFPPFAVVVKEFLSFWSVADVAGVAGRRFISLGH